MAISKVIFGDTTLIDITDTDASATTVQAGKKFYDSAGVLVTGTGSALSHTTETLTNGGTAHYINGIDLGGDTVRATALASGYTAHDQYGNAITGTLGNGTTIDVSDTTATASDVLSGKSFYAADGSYTNGSFVVPPLKRGVLRPDAELVKTWSHDSLFVTDDEGTISAYSTTAKTLHTGAAITPTQSLSLANYRYFVLVRCLTIPVYNTNTKQAGRPDYSVTSGLYEIAEVDASTFTSLDGAKTYATRYTTVYAAGAGYRMPYWTSATGFGVYTASSYGVHQTLVAPTISSSTSATPTLTVKDPNLVIRGSTTYLTSATWGTLTDIRRQYVIELYRISKANDTLTGWGVWSQMLHIRDCVNTTNHNLT